MENQEKKEKIIRIHEALENLSSIAQLNGENDPMLGIVKNHKFVLSDSEHGYKTVHWLTPETAVEIIEHIKQTYKTVLEYLKAIYDSDEFNWEDPNNRKGLQAMITLVAEAATNLDAYIDHLNAPYEIPRLTESKQYTDLQDFFLKKLPLKLEVKLDEKEAWEEDWVENENILAIDTERLGLKDFETVKRDREYELFYLRNEMGHPYFHSALLRNIKLVCHFDEIIDSPIEEDPLLRVRAMQDRDLHGASQQILNGSMKIAQNFFKYSRGKLEDFYQFLNRALMALMLTANPRNLLQNTMGKSSLLYFSDFQDFLVKSLNTSDYKRFLAYPPKEKDKAASFSMQLINRLCLLFFTRAGAIKEEFIGLLHFMIEKGKEMSSKNLIKPYETSIWNEFLEYDDSIRTLLKCYPNGPLFKILDLLRSEELKEKNIAFDPIHQENYPFRVYVLSTGEGETNCLRLPSPTRQLTVKSAEVIEEFEAFIRGLQTLSQMYLIFNFQSRVSWKESARSQALEQFSKRAEIHKSCIVFTLPKDTDFYYQVDAHYDKNDAKEFTKTLFDLLFNIKDSGYYLGIIKDENQFSLKLKQLITFIHDCFFDKKEKLDRKNRLDFIEIFYHFFYLEMIEFYHPNYLSFVCKDGIDVSNATNASFYALIKLIKKGKLEKEEKDYLLWLYYRPAFLVRERSIDSARFNRTLSFLDWVDAKMKGKKKEQVHGRYPWIKKAKLTN